MTEHGSDEVLESAIGTGRGAFAPATQTAFVLNETAARIWDLAREGLSDGSVAEQLSDETGAPLTEVGPHVVTALAELRRQGLLPSTTES